MEFTASLDSSAKVTTTFVCVLFLGIAIWNVRSMMRAKGDSWNTIIRVFIFAVLILSVVVSYRYGTTGYETKGKTLVIKKHNGPLTLNYLQISDVRKVGAAEMTDISRTFGVGGLFGYSGRYHNTTIGDMTFYATQQQNWVLLHTDKNEAIILTPDNPDKFVIEIKSIITPNN